MRDINKDMTNTIPLFTVYNSPLVKEAVGRVIDSGFVGQGPVNDQFEADLREFFGIDYLNTTNSATSAEHLAYHLLRKYGLQDGDESLTTALSCSATHVVIPANRLKIKWLDIDPKTLNIDYDDLERKIGPRTKVINLVSWGGTPNNLDRIAEIRDRTYVKFGFYPWVICDNAHAFGAKYKGKLLGTTHGFISTFSFQAIKLLQTFDGGALLSPGFEDFYRRGRLLRWFGLDRDDKSQKDLRCHQNCKEWGFKFHQNDISSAAGVENLKHVPRLLKAHQDNAAYYDQNLKGIGGLALLDRHPDYESSFWIYSMLVEDRDNFNKWMKECGIAVSMVHDRVDKHDCFSESKAFLPNLDRTIGRLTNIPVHHAVTSEQREYIVSCIKEGW